MADLTALLQQSKTMLPAKYAFEAIGTLWSIETKQPLTEQEKAHIHATIEAFDTAYSRFRKDSLVRRVCDLGPGRYEFPASIAELYDTYVLLERVSGGAVNPLVGISLERLGYDASYSLVPQAESPFVPPSFAASVLRRGHTLQFKQPLLFDIGAIGKGYLVDALASIVAEQHDTYVVDGSGDIAVHSEQPDVVGLEDPRDPKRVLGEVRLQNKSICASAINRRVWGNGFHHIIDAATGMPAKSDVVASWAVADTTMMADALATALFFVPGSTLYQTFGDFSYVILKKDGSVEHTIGAIGELYV